MVRVLGIYQGRTYTVVVMVESGRSGGGTSAPIAQKVYQAISTATNCRRRARRSKWRATPHDEATLNPTESRIDRPMLGALLLLMLIGVAFIYSATMVNDAAASLRGTAKKHIVQMGWYTVGSIAAVMLCFMSYQTLARWAFLAYWGHDPHARCGVDSLHWHNPRLGCAPLDRSWVLPVSTVRIREAHVHSRARPLPKPARR